MIYSVLSTLSFCDFLAERLIKQSKDNVWGMSQITIYVPTNRAAKTLKEAFLRHSNKQTLLLPTIVSFANLDSFASNVPEAIPPLERQLILSKLILQKSPMGEDKAFALAADLALLIDEFHHYEVDFEKLKNIPPENFAAHWQQTLDFLEIVQTHWPHILAERGQLDPALRQIRLIENQIAAWQKAPPQTPVLALGFTGGLPIIEKFLKAICALPQGDIYIPNIDTCLKDDVWDKLDETHPQFLIKRLLDTLNVKRSEITQITPLNARFSLLSEALKPAACTNDWQYDLNIDPKALQNVQRIDCKTPQTEAFEIACLLRQALETPEKTAALVTNDRQLARRVKVQMQKWGILLDDSAGTPLSNTPIGTFLILLAECFAHPSSTNMLALLKHPLALDGHEFNAFRKSLHEIEKKARKDAMPFQIKLNADVDSFACFFANPVRVPKQVLINAHLSLAEQLARSQDKSGSERLWAKEAGQAASDLFTDLLSCADILGDIEPLSYPAWIKAVLDTVTVRPRYGMHPRLDILGPIEARLQQPDLVIIGEVNEDTFPSVPNADAFINRPMRVLCQMPLPEEKIGVSAQDFAHLFQAKEVILTRAQKVDGTPTIQSRWLARMEAVLAKEGIAFNPLSERFGQAALRTNDFHPAQQPKPTPQSDKRPTKLSISDICALLSDPYIVYAKKVLRLNKLEDLDEPLTPAQFGTALHNAFAKFALLPETEQTYEELVKLGRTALAEQGITEQNSGFYYPRLDCVAKWFVKTQSDLFPYISKIYTEVTGITELSLADGTAMKLEGRADRIDVLKDASIRIIDYKTGQAPSAKKVLAGFAPQLPLEAWLISQKAFADIKEDLRAFTLEYWQLSDKIYGGKQTAVMKCPSEEIVAIQLAGIEQNLRQLLERYHQAAQPYTACPNPKYAPKYNDYAHLERTAEWQTEDEGDEQ